MGRRLVWGLLIAFLCCAISLFLAPNDLHRSLVAATNHAQQQDHHHVNRAYNDALSKAILFFQGQRSGKLPADQRVTWRGDSALADGQPDNVNLVGGYYDAGDNVKFGWTMSYTTSLLCWAAIEYRQQITSAGEIEHLRQAIRWATDFLLRSHTSSTTFYTQVGDGNKDHSCWERPEDMDTPRTLYKITSQNPGSEAAGDAAAALAAASMVFKHVDAAYSSKLLQHAKSLFEFADKYRGSYGASCPFYCSYSGYQDELLWGATWLYEATGDKKYHGYLTSNQGWSGSVSEFSWDNKLAGVQTLLAKRFNGGDKELGKYKSDAESFICALMPGSGSQQIQTTPGGLMYTRDSSNLQYVTSSSMLLFIYSKNLAVSHVNGVHCNSKYFSASQIRAFAKSQVDYILGENPMKMSYMVGYGSKFPQQLHHRGSSLPSIKSHKPKISCNDGYDHYYSSSQPNPNVHVGALVGGPDSSDNYPDQRSDYSHAEPTTYINAGFIGSVAALL
ncbi:unnamed protein product [Linum trigynum]|uniref:Endoglucanase n=1 Tax=Linum trigynum TaxID=586398 RepID=A0AAV2DP02_9ROSI